MAQFTSAHTVRCKLTGEGIGGRLDGGWCICPDRCMLAQHAERIIDDEARQPPHRMLPSDEAIKKAFGGE